MFSVILLDVFFRISKCMHSTYVYDAVNIHKNHPLNWKKVREYIMQFYNDTLISFCSKKAAKVYCAIYNILIRMWLVFRKVSEYNTENMFICLLLWTL